MVIESVKRLVGRIMGRPVSGQLVTLPKAHLSPPPIGWALDTEVNYDGQTWMIQWNDGSRLEGHLVQMLEVVGPWGHEFFRCGHCWSDGTRCDTYTIYPQATEHRRRFAPHESSSQGC